MCGQRGKRFGRRDGGREAIAYCVLRIWIPEVELLAMLTPSGQAGHEVAAPRPVSPDTQYALRNRVIFNIRLLNNGGRATFSA
jgi:hypothetical protein